MDDTEGDGEENEKREIKANVVKDGDGRREEGREERERGLVEKDVKRSSKLRQQFTA